MSAFFEHMEPETATTIADVSRRMYDVREGHKRLLADVGYVDADELLEAVRQGEMPEHPGYEAWLAIHLMREREHALREILAWRCQLANGGRGVPAPASELAALAAALRPALPSAFQGRMALNHDGIALHGRQGMEVLVRILSSVAWSFEWRWEGALWRMDTAPVAHPGVHARAHVHRPDGRVVDDPLPLPAGQDIIERVRVFLAAVTRTPTLGLD